jgi:hypothetical protein
VELLLLVEPGEAEVVVMAVVPLLQHRPLLLFGLRLNHLWFQPSHRCASPHVLLWRSDPDNMHWEVVQRFDEELKAILEQKKKDDPLTPKLSRE